jgi:hypothetical protein
LLANWITLSRFPLLLSNILILYLGTPRVRLAGVVLLFGGLMLDTVDGMVARKTGQTSRGSVLDAADRPTSWSGLLRRPGSSRRCHRHHRAHHADRRARASKLGEAPFDQQRSAGPVLVGPRMRVGYSVSKVVTFCVAAVQALAVAARR